MSLIYNAIRTPDKHPSSPSLSICKEREQANLYGVREVESTIKQYFGVE